MNHAVLFATIAGLLTAISFGFADFLAAKSSKQDSAESTSLWVAIVNAALFAVVFIFDRGHTAWTSAGLLYSLAAGLTLGTGLLFFYKGLEEGPVSVTSPVGGAYPLVTTFVVVAFLGGHLTGLNYIGIGLVMAGVIAASGLVEVKKSETRLTSGVKSALVTFVIWGVGYALLGKAVALLGWQKSTFVELCFEIVAISIVLPILNGKNPLAGRSYKILKSRFIIATSLIQLLAVVIFNIGLTRSPSPAIITAIAATYPALTVFLALKHLNEKQSLAALLGSVVTIAGVVVLSIQ